MFIESQKRISVHLSNPCHQCFYSLLTIDTQITLIGLIGTDKISVNLFDLFDQCFYFFSI